jgi:hypothetical protein
MRRFLSLVLVALLALTNVVAFADADEEIVITYGKQFDYDGMTFIHDQTLEDNYYTQYIKENTTCALSLNGSLMMIPRRMRLR